MSELEMQKNVDVVVHAHKVGETNLGQLNETPETIAQKIGKIKDFWNPEMPESSKDYHEKMTAVVDAIVRVSISYNVDYQGIVDEIYGKNKVSVFKLIKSGAIKIYDWKHFKTDDGQGNPVLDVDDWDPAPGKARHNPDAYQYASRWEIHLRINSSQVFWGRIYHEKSESGHRKFAIASKIMYRDSDGLVGMNLMQMLPIETFDTFEEAHKALMAKYEAKYKVRNLTEDGDHRKGPRASGKEEATEDDDGIYHHPQGRKPRDGGGLDVRPKVDSRDAGEKPVELDFSKLLENLKTSNNPHWILEQLKLVVRTKLPIRDAIDAVLENKNVKWNEYIVFDLMKFVMGKYPHIDKVVALAPNPYKVVSDLAWNVVDIFPQDSISMIIPKEVLSDFAKDLGGGFGELFLENLREFKKRYPRKFEKVVID